MIEAKFQLDKDKKKITFKLKGHAGAGSIGKDLVCAAASMLAYTLAQSIKDESEMYGYETPTIKLNSGDAKIECQCDTENKYITALHTFSVIQNGYMLLEHQYPRLVKLTQFAKSE